MSPPVKSIRPATLHRFKIDLMSSFSPFPHSNTNLTRIERDFHNSRLAKGVGWYAMRQESVSAARTGSFDSVQRAARYYFVPLLAVSSLSDGKTLTIGLPGRGRKVKDGEPFKSYDG
jgi:hypothetical protein